MPFADRDRQRRYLAHWHQANKQHRRGAVTLRRDEKRRLVAEYKAQRGCQGTKPDGSACGERDPDVLDLHHVEAKTASITVAIRDYPLDRLLEELSYCHVLCACCHRRLHAAERRGAVPTPHWRSRSGRAKRKPG